MLSDKLTGDALSSVELKPDDMSLLIGWRDRVNGLSANRVPHEGDVRAALHGFARGALDSFQEAEAVDYDHADAPGEDEFFLFRIPEDSTQEVDEERELPTGELLGVIDNAGAHEALALANVREANYLFYAVVCQTTTNESITFVRRQIQLKVARGSRLFATFGGQLKVVTDPVFAFSEYFDFVVFRGQIAMRDSRGVNAFELLFADLELLKQATPQYCSEFSTNLNLGFDEGIEAVFEDTCQKKPSLGTRVRKLRKAPHLPNLTIESFQEDIASYPEIAGGLAVIDGKLKMASGDVKGFLDLVEQRVWRGRYDGGARVAGSVRVYSGNSQNS